MQIVLNGNEEKVEVEMTILDFLVSKGMNVETIIAEYNGDIVKKDKWISIILQDKDRLEILNFVGGG